ncbi:hypothetical protein TNCV_2089661 [Trichonephila clavipes]|nr:hypothetical protein TNCV_2089661 [Trichonephila clavipes]
MDVIDSTRNGLHDTRFPSARRLGRQGCRSEGSADIWAADNEAVGSTRDYHMILIINLAIRDSRNRASPFLQRICLFITKGATMRRNPLQNDHSICSQASLVLIYRPTEKDERLSRPCPARNLPHGPAAWKYNTLPVSHWASEVPIYFHKFNVYQSKKERKY